MVSGIATKRNWYVIESDTHIAIIHTQAYLDHRPAIKTERLEIESAGYDILYRARSYDEALLFMNIHTTERKEAEKRERDCDRRVLQWRRSRGGER